MWQRLPEPDGRNVTVFQRDDGLYGYVIADENGPYFSPGQFESQRDAMLALYDQVNEDLGLVDGEVPTKPKKRAVRKDRNRHFV